MKLVLGLLLVPAIASAGGLGRPNGISARGVGMGGAWSAWVDDATAVFFNPAAMSDVDQQVQVGGELVVGPRSYTPLADDGTRGPAQKTTVVAPVPALGVVGRFTYDERPSAFTLGAGLANTFGGKVKYDKTGQPAFDSTEDLVVETATGAALRVSDRLSVGAAIRVGVGLFDVQVTEKPFDASLSASGVGVAMTWGALFKPTDKVRIAAVWRSPMRITTTGSGTIELPGGTSQATVTHDQVWPQQASMGLGIRASDRVKLAAQLDWTAWSQVDKLVVKATGVPDQIYPEAWKDTWTPRIGVSIDATDAVAVRGGAYMDTNAVPDRTIERQYLDGTKYGVAGGASLVHAAWRIDAGIDAVLSPAREVPNNSAATTNFPADRNIAPGTHEGTLITFELSVAYRF